MKTYKEELENIDVIKTKLCKTIPSSELVDLSLDPHQTPKEEFEIEFSYNHCDGFQENLYEILMKYPSLKEDQSMKYMMNNLDSIKNEKKRECDFIKDYLEKTKEYSIILELLIDSYHSFKYQNNQTFKAFVIEEIQNIFYRKNTKTENLEIVFKLNA